MREVVFEKFFQVFHQYLFQLKERLTKIRTEYPDSERIDDIEIKYAQAVEIHISATLFIIGG